MGTKISTTQAYCKVYFKKKEKENTMATYRVNIIYILAFLLITQLIPLLWGSISQFSSVAQSSPTLCDPVNRSTPGLPVHHQLPEFTQTRVHWVGWCHPAISISVVPFSYCPQALLASGSFPISQLVAWRGQSIGVSASASVLPMTDLLYDGLVGSPCSPRDSQESSPTPQFKSINSSMLSFLHSPTLTSIHDRWKNHSSD